MRSRCYVVLRTVRRSFGLVIGAIQLGRERKRQRGCNNNDDGEPSKEGK